MWVEEMVEGERDGEIEPEELLRELLAKTAKLEFGISSSDSVRHL